MLGRTDRHLRMVALLLIFTIFGTATTLRLGYWQVIAAPDLVAEAISKMTPPQDPGPPRADIIDRHGLKLAQSATFDRLDAYPRDIPAERRADIVETLDGILKLTPVRAGDLSRQALDGPTLGLAEASSHGRGVRGDQPGQGRGQAAGDQPHAARGPRLPASAAARAARRWPATCWASWPATAVAPTVWSACTTTA